MNLDKEKVNMMTLWVKLIERVFLIDIYKIRCLRNHIRKINITSFNLI